MLESEKMIKELEEIHQKLDKKGTSINILICRKVRRDSASTGYIFQKIQITRDIEADIHKWLTENVGRVKKLKRDGNAQEEDLKKVDAWQPFFDSMIQAKERADLPKNSDAIIVYSVVGTRIVGYIRRLTRSGILSRKGLFILFQSDGTFNALKEEIGLRVDSGSDIVFLANVSRAESSETAFVFNQNIFNQLFEIREQQIKEVRTLLTDSSIEQYLEGVSFDEFKNFLINDGILRRMILTGVAKNGFRDFSFERLVTYKHRLKAVLPFEIDEKKKKIVVDPQKLKETIKSIIKVVGKWYREVLDKSGEIYEGPAEKRVG